MRGSPIVLATAAKIELAENLIALATDITESVMFMAERTRHLDPADEQELIRLLTVAAKLKQTALAVRSMGGDAGD